MLNGELTPSIEKEKGFDSKNGDLRTRITTFGIIRNTIKSNPTKRKNITTGVDVV